jgi:hypothetical protein
MENNQPSQIYIAPDTQVNNSPSVPAPLPIVPKKSISLRNIVFLLIGVIGSLLVFIIFLLIINYFNIISLNRMSKAFSFLPQQALIQKINSEKLPISTKTQEFKEVKTTYNLQSTKLATIPVQYTNPSGGFFEFTVNGGKVAYVMISSPSSQTASMTDDLFINDTKIKSSWRVDLPLFTKDGERYAYAYSNSYGNDILVLDGKDTKGKNLSNFGLNSAFSLDGKRFAYASTSVGGSNSYVVLDGKEGKHYESIGTASLKFSPDNKTFAYVAGSSGNQSRMVVNGIEGKTYDIYVEMPYFSPDGKRLVYIAGDKNFWYVIDNDKVLATYNAKDYSLLDSYIVFSEDSKKIAYSVSQGAQEFLVIDGVEGKKYDKFLSVPQFSKELSKVVFLAQRNNKSYLVTNSEEKELTVNDNIIDPFISSDGSRVGYIEAVGNEAHVDVSMVAGDKSFKVFFASPTMALLFAKPIFSPDSNNIAYIGTEGTTESNMKYFVVINDKKGNQYDAILTDLKFSPDGKKVMYGARLGHELWWVVDTVGL